MVFPLLHLPPTCLNLFALCGRVFFFPGGCAPLVSLMVFLLPLARHSFQLVSLLLSPPLVPWVG